MCAPGIPMPPGQERRLFQPQPRSVLISFSGLDGAGKSTQIEHLRAHLEASGLATTLLAFWDDVVVGKRYRESFVHAVYQSEVGVGTPGRPVNRRDKNVRHWYLSLARHGLYLLDALHLRHVVHRASANGPTVLIMDRFVYDELANLPLSNAFSRAYARFIAKVVAPQPDLAFVLDADPEAARARKPEYPVEFMRECRQWYYRLADLLGGLTIVPPLPLAAVTARVVEQTEHILPVSSRCELRST